LIAHGAGHVDEEHEVARGELFSGEFFPLEPDEDELVRLIPRALARFDVDGERVFSLRLGIVVGEVIDQLFYAYGIGGRERARREEAPHVAV
jgi:hypothetical protein